jgi:hypothetical protein
MRIQVYILTAALAAAPAGLLRAADQPAAAPVSSAPVAAAAAPAGPCPQQFMTICVREWVPEPCTYTRTTYKTECRQEAYTAYRCEVVPETKTRTVCHMRRVCETVMENRCYTVKVPVCETRVEMHTTWKRVNYTEMKTRTVDRGHYECCQVPDTGGLFGFCKKHDPCACPPMKTVQKWVPCKVTECYPVCRTKCERVCEPVCKQVTTYRCETRTCQVPVQRVRCVPEYRTETYTCCTTRMVPYPCTRTVQVCVPVCETVQGCRMVCRVVQKQVPVSNVCGCCPAPVCCH